MHHTAAPQVGTYPCAHNHCKWEALISSSSDSSLSVPSLSPPYDCVLYFLNYTILYTGFCVKHLGKERLLMSKIFPKSRIYLMPSDADEPPSPSSTLCTLHKYHDRLGVVSAAHTLYKAHSMSRD